jgi:hypothetical protein
MSDDRPAWFYRRDPWYWATWEGSRLASLLAARDLSFWDRLGRVEELARRAEKLAAAGSAGSPGPDRGPRAGADPTAG